VSSILQAIRRPRLALTAAGALVVLYSVLAYFFLPLVWKRYEHQKALAGLSMLTRTIEGIPGDPINIGLVGSKEDVVCAMHAAGWFPADPVTFLSSVKIVGSVLLNRPYPDAPVSHLYYAGKREELAFERPSGKSADKRHHVRFWQASDSGEEGRPLWLGAVTFDRGVGFSHRNAKITHHIAPNIDAERDLLSADLKDARVVESAYEVGGIGPTINARNGGGDSYFSDGEIKFSVLTEGCSARAALTSELENPPLIEAHDRIWPAIAKAARWLMGERPAEDDQ
jgi:LssY C-terminus